MSDPNQSNPPANNPASANKPSGSGKTALIIILVIVGALVLLGVGGYFGWKAISKKFLKTAASVTTSPSAVTSGLTISKLEEMIKYPNSTVIGTDRSIPQSSTLTMETNDPLATVNNYYLSLNPASKWTVSSQSIESDGSRADITYTGKSEEFSIRLVIDNYYGKTSILAETTSESLPLGTPLGSTVSPALGTPTPATSSATTSTTKKTILTDYVIADSATRVIAEAELISLTPWELKVARNEIYARHGRPFVHKDLQCYFASKSWYQIYSNFSESILNTTETANIATIQAYEQKIASPLQSTDSGC